MAKVEDEVSVGDWKGLKAGGRNVSIGLELGVGCGIRWFGEIRSSRVLDERGVDQGYAG